MSRIEDMAKALKRSGEIFEELSGLGNCPAFAVEEIYNPSAGRYEDGELNSLAWGDNLEYMEYLLKEKEMGGKIQMIYVDPPFFSNSRYQASVRLETEKLGKSPLIKAGAYDDTWEDNMEQYLTMLAIRFRFMRELLSDKGSIWVHLDWHGAHYVKILLDEIFGADNFINEVCWTYKSGGASKRSFARKHDTLLFYSKTDKYKFNPQKEKSYNRGYKPYRFKGVEEYEDQLGWYTLVNMKDVWTIDMVGRTSAERTGYATQKPEKLLERIINACTDEGDICADFFAGSGTLGAVAEKTGRRWLMCDEGDVAVSGQIKRLCNMEWDGRKCTAFAVKRPKRNPDEAASRLVRFTDDMGCLRIIDYVPDVLKLSDSDEHVAMDFIRNDSRSCIDFWSVDAHYDGHIHRTSELIGGTDFCRMPDGNDIHAIGYDVFGNRFCWEKTD